ncbi:hypothetical protein L1787_18690 [Acuticoccus sp. M5D2P5]|uniref:hypothetical protein n=1 Tax=Acuticoccus kalidii TaxID=2910977 RepID=UPI001F257386|nr:hypothetical protein [Acuticoccus kalidii]MCF3935422.1 hypothetical protein [Acuticoccus kalidii]
MTIETTRFIGFGGLLAALLLVAGCVGGADGGADAARSGCVAPASLSDADDDLSVLGDLCARETTFTEGGESWRIQTIESGRRGPLFVLPHDDENASLATAAYALKRYGGAATMVETGGRRMNGSIDPNRNFDAGALRCGKPGRSERFVAAMLAPGGRPVIALHTNARGSARTGGSGSISIRAPYAGATAFPVDGASEDAMVILASRNGAEDGKVRRLAEALNAAGVNVLVETVDLDDTDCSLSHYAVASGIAYANVEAAHGDAATQRAILDVLIKTL